MSDVALWIKDLESFLTKIVPNWYDPPCPNCDHKRSQHLESSPTSRFCRVEEEQTTASHGDGFLRRKVQQCVCSLSYSDIDLNLVNRAANLAKADDEKWIARRKALDEPPGNDATSDAAEPLPSRPDTPAVPGEGEGTDPSI